MVLGFHNTRLHNCLVELDALVALGESESVTDKWTEQETVVNMFTLLYLVDKE